MKRMRFLVIVLIVWLFLFYNIERLSEPFNLTSTAYTFVPAMVALVVLIPRVRKISIWALTLMPIPVFVVVKAWAGSKVLGAAIPVTVTEICAIVLTTILARYVSNAIHEFESAVANITLGPPEALPEPFSVGQSEIYREVRRARRYQRPLALMTVKVEDASIGVALDRMVQEVQKTLVKQYLLSSVSRTLRDELQDNDIIARRDSHFVVVLPEATDDKLPTLIKRLRETVSKEVGVNLHIGTASLSKDTATFESLMEKAVADMEKEEESMTETSSAAPRIQNVAHG